MTVLTTVIQVTRARPLALSPCRLVLHSPSPSTERKDSDLPWVSTFYGEPLHEETLCSSTSWLLATPLQGRALEGNGALNDCSKIRQPGNGQLDSNTDLISEAYFFLPHHHTLLRDPHAPAQTFHELHVWACTVHNINTFPTCFVTNLT